MSSVVYSGSMDSYFRHCADENARERELYRQQREDEATSTFPRYVVARGVNSGLPYAVRDTHRGGAIVGEFDTEKFARRMAAKSNVVAR